jgi:hypothetical protein
MIYKAPFVNLQSHEKFDKWVLALAFQLDGSIPILYWIDRPIFSQFISDDDVHNVESNWLV